MKLLRYNLLLFLLNFFQVNANLETAFQCLMQAPAYQSRLVAAAAQLLLPIAAVKAAVHLVARSCCCCCCCRRDGQLGGEAVLGPNR